MSYGAWAAVIFISIAVAALFLRPAPPPLAPTSITGKVTYVYDGDTLKISAAQKRIRVWGIDAPEKGEKGAQEATEALKRLTLGKTVKVIIMDHDTRYDRIVGRIELKDGRDVSRVMIEGGYAVEFCRYSKGYYGHCK